MKNKRRKARSRPLLVPVQRVEAVSLDIGDRVRIRNGVTFAGKIGTITEIQSHSWGRKLRLALDCRGEQRVKPACWVYESETTALPRELDAPVVRDVDARLIKGLLPFELAHGASPARPLAHLAGEVRAGGLPEAQQISENARQGRGPAASWVVDKPIAPARLARYDNEVPQVPTSAYVIALENARRELDALAGLLRRPMPPRRSR